VKLIAGLGNPGPRYAGSRHNIGFMVVDELVRRWQLGPGRYESFCQGLVWDTQQAEERVLLIKPLTFMNCSGASVAALSRYYRLDCQDLLVAVDDLDLPVGQIRLRAGGSSGGHHGLADVIRHLGTDQFPRLRVGIGKVPAAATVEYVLSRFTPQEQEIIAAAVRTAADAAQCWIEEGITAAMNRFNRPPQQGGAGQCADRPLGRSGPNRAHAEGEDS
jgi:PTH1 family peptidyl-tRNA hydrolase